MKKIISLISIILMMILMTACASQRLPTRAMPENATFAGKWYSNFGDLKLVLQGDELMGTFAHGKGGTIRGVVRGGVADFYWIQPGDLAVGRLEVKGHGYFIMGDDGKTLSGRWGFENSYDNGGEWTAEKVDLR